MERPMKTHWQESGVDPDYRFSLANERTFLAWIRTALALLAGAILVLQFTTRLQPPWMHLVLSLVLVLIAGILSCGAYLRWKENEVAMRHSRTLPRSMLLPFMAGSATTVALVAGVILGLQ